MRVTNNMMTANLLYNVNKNLEYMSKRQDELATGKRIHRPSDDPVLAAKVLARRTDLAELEQYDKNTRDALGWLEVTEKALEDNGNIFQRIRELTVQAANGTNTAEDTQKIKLEIEAMKSQLITNANSTFAGRYIFSGFETDKPLMNKDGTFNIDVDQYSLDNKPKVKYEVSVGEAMDVMTSGLDIYGTSEQVNVMTDRFPSGGDIGNSATRSLLSRSFDLTADHTASTLDVTLGALPAFNVIEASLNGSALSLTKEQVLDAYNTASDGTNVLSDVANVYFDSNDKLIVEAKSFGAIAISAAGSTASVGNNVSEASVVGSVIGPPDLLAGELSVAERTMIKETSLNIVVNGISKKIKPSTTASIVTVADYVAEMQLRLNDEFGAGNISITETGGAITVSTTGTADGVKPELIVDFPRTNKSTMMEDLDRLITYMETGSHDKLSEMLETIDFHQNNMLSLRADIGARSNRMDMISKKIASNNVSFTQLLSDAEDADMSEVIMKLKNAENVYKASLSTGARVIQPSLVDFLS